MTAGTIVAEGLGKRYRVGAVRERHDTVRDRLTHLGRGPMRAFRARTGDEETRPTIWALKDVSFSVEPGEAVGIIGRNGVGKSTLLKILSRVTEPTTGRAEIHGRVGSLLEVGTGFHPELTGRENIFLNGAILGMSRLEIESKFDEIVEFAEVAKFIDTPLKRYSSGMYVRLAFAVAGHLEPEILLVDEVLAVGDTAFQKKCIAKMDEVGRQGRTILFVSHNMGAISEFCTRGIVLDQGHVVMDAPVDLALTRYAELIAPISDGDGSQASFPVDPGLSCSIVEVKVTNAEGAPTRLFDLADEVVLSVKYEVHETTVDYQINVTIARNMTPVLNTYDTDDQVQLEPKERGVFVASHRLPARFLKAGVYNITVGSGTGRQLYQLFENVLRFEIDELSENTHLRGYRRERPGQVISPGLWRVERIDDFVPPTPTPAAISAANDA